MKKVLAAAVLMLGILVLPGISRAQYADDEPCNQTYAKTGLGSHGSGSNGEIVNRYFVTLHYEAKDMNGVKSDAPEVFTTFLNAAAQDQNLAVRFASTDYDNPDPNYNLTFRFDIYSNDDDTYSVYLVVRGWGQGHLFRVSYINGTLEDGIKNVTSRAASMIQNGWTCEN